MRNDTFVVVDKITTEIDEDDMPVDVLYGWYKGKYVGFGSSETVTVKRTVKNFVPEQKLNYIMAAVLYKGNILTDAKFSQTGEFSDEYVFEADFNIPEQSSEYKIHLMVLDSEMIPVLKRTVIE